MGAAVAPRGSFLKNTCLYSRDSLYDLLNKHPKKQQSFNWKYKLIKCMLLINLFMLSDGFPITNFCFGFLFFGDFLRVDGVMNEINLQGISPQSCTETDFEMKTSNLVLFLLISVVSVHFRAIDDETIPCQA